jgi:uncharacterized protein YgiM (DUF1202 family)
VALITYLRTCNRVMSTQLHGKMPPSNNGRDRVDSSARASSLVIASRDIRLALGGLLALALLAPREARAERVEIQATRLTVRAGPGTKHKRIGSVPKGRVYEVLQRKGGWVAIQIEQRKGWVFGRYVRVVTGKRPAAGKTPAAGEGTHAVKATRLNVRSRASLKGKIRFRLRRGTRVTVAETKGEWVRITHRGRSGWVMSKFLTSDDLPPPRRRVRKRRPRPRRRARPRRRPRRAAQP